MRHLRKIANSRKIIGRIETKGNSRLIIEFVKTQIGEITKTKKINVLHKADLIQ